jgi:MoaD family protein
MTISVKLFGVFQRLMGKKSKVELEIEGGTTIIQLLEKIFSGKYGSKTTEDVNRLDSLMMILVNGIEIKLSEGMHTVLKSGDEISILPR